MHFNYKHLSFNKLKYSELSKYMNEIKNSRNKVEILECMIIFLFLFFY